MKVKALMKLTVTENGKETAHAKDSEFDMDPAVARNAADLKQVKIVEKAEK